MFQCNICLISFTTQSNLNRHLKNVHKQIEKNFVAYDYECFNSKCLEENCCTSYRKVSELRCHLEQVHKKILEKETVSFSTEENFNTWLKKISKRNNLEYVRKENKGYQYVYYNCNRSYNPTGKIDSKTENFKRAMKSQGSCKMMYKCTSQIILTRASGGQYCATYYKTHYGHTIDVQHIRIPKQDRIDIATKLTSGVSVTRVLDSYRTNFNESSVSRCDLITRKDIQNIASSYKINIQDGVRHENDSVSVDLLVQESRQIGDEILLYKKQGQEYPGLINDDFCLIFMNKMQENILKKFGKKIIAIDSTHGLNIYDFELTTVMVIDEFGEGFPVCSMFSNRKDTTIYEVLFNCIKMRCGFLQPEVFMSDITSVYYNAWLSIMEIPVKNRLYCSWHIDRAWRTNLSKISTMDSRKQVYQQLKILQYGLNITEFERNLSIFVKHLLKNTETVHFGNYFTQNYVSNRKMWAYCYRINCGINTNMVLESMHKTVKYFYLDGKVVKRLDKGITAVMKYVRDKIVSRKIKITKGVNNSHIQKIHKSHRTAVTSKYQLTRENCNIWRLKSAYAEYVVSKKDDACTFTNCSLKCSFCNICIHQYACTCQDYSIKACICKHIHYINLQLNYTHTSSSPHTSMETSNSEISNCLSALSQSSSNIEAETLKSEIKEEINKTTCNLESPHTSMETSNSEISNCLSALSQSSSNIEAETLKSEIKEEINKTTCNLESPHTSMETSNSAISNCSTETLISKIKEEIDKTVCNLEFCKGSESVQVQVLPHIFKTFKNANNMLTNMELELNTFKTPNDASDQPPNKKIKKQMSFFSTKNKSKPTTKRITGPSRSEAIDIDRAFRTITDHDYC